MLYININYNTTIYITVYYSIYSIHTVYSKIVKFSPRRFQRICSPVAKRDPRSGFSSRLPWKFTARNTDYKN